MKRLIFMSLLIVGSFCAYSQAYSDSIGAEIYGRLGKYHRFDCCSQIDKETISVTVTFKERYLFPEDPALDLDNLYYEMLRPTDIQYCAHLIESRLLKKFGKRKLSKFTKSCFSVTPSISSLYKTVGNEMYCEADFKVTIYLQK